MTIQWLFLPGLASRLKCEKFADDNEKRQRTVAHKLMTIAHLRLGELKINLLLFVILPICITHSVLEVNKVVLVHVHEVTKVEKRVTILKCISDYFLLIYLFRTFIESLYISWWDSCYK